MIFCLAISKLRLHTAAVALALSVSVAVASEQVDASRWFAAEGEHDSNDVGYGPLSQHFLEGQHSVRGSGKRVTETQNEEASLTFQNTICSEDIFSMFCEVVDSVSGRDDVTSRLSTGRKYVDFVLDFSQEFTLFAPANSAFTLDGKRLRVTLPEGLSVADFLDNHIIEGEAYSFDDLSRMCSVEIPTKMTGETTRTVCDPWTNTPLWQSGRGNVNGDRPRFIGGKYRDKIVGHGRVHVINGFIKPKNFVPSQSPSAMPSVSMIPSGIPSDIPSNTPSISMAPSDMPSDIPSDTPSILPSDMPSRVPSDIPSGIPSGLPSDMPSGIPSDVPSDMPSGIPSDVPSGMPSDIPSVVPSGIPSDIPSDVPSDIPSDEPSSKPSVTPPVVTRISSNSGGENDLERLPTDTPSTIDPTWSPTTWFPTISEYPTRNVDNARGHDIAHGGIIDEASTSETTIETPNIAPSDFPSPVNSDRPSDGPSLVNSDSPMVESSHMPSPPFSRRQTKRERQREKRRKRRESLAMNAAANETITEVNSVPADGEAENGNGGGDGDK